MESPKSAENSQTMKNIHEGLDSIVSGYITEFINQFDNFSNQIQIADLLLKAYEYRYDKIQGKWGNINDITWYNFQSHNAFVDNCNKWKRLEDKMTTIEQKLVVMNEKLENILIKNKIAVPEGKGLGSTRKNEVK